MTNKIENGLTFFSLVLKDLNARRLRYGLAVLGLGITLMGAITMVGLSESIETTLEKGYKAKEVDLVVLQARKMDPLSSRLPQSLIHEIRKIPGVSSAQGYLNDVVTLGNNQTTLIFGWLPDSPELIYQKGKQDYFLNFKEVLVGWALSELAGFKKDDFLEINLRKYKIMGTYSTGSLAEDGGVYMRLDDMQQLLDIRGKVSFINVTLDHKVTKPEAISKRIERLLTGIRALTVSQFMKGYAHLAMIRGLSQVVMLSSIILAILIVSMIMIMSVNERIKELAILRAVGWSQWRIASLIFAETGAVTIFGTLLGLFLGRIGLSLAIDYLHGMGFFIESILTPFHLFWIAIITVGIGIIGSALPVYYALRVRVVEALKYE